MHNSSYSQPKFVLEAKNIRKSKGKSCGYYLRVVFFFSSLIQTLIIVSLVLFLVYGRPEKTVEEKRVEELENGFNKLSKDNTDLRKDKIDLTSLLKSKAAEKDAVDKKLKKLEDDLISAKANSTKLLQELTICKSQRLPVRSLPHPDLSIGLSKSLQDQRELQKLKSDLESAMREKSKLEMAVMKLNQEKDNLSSELQIYMKTCEKDFIASLHGIQSVTNAFHKKIDELFPKFTFHLTCAKQQEEAVKICENCTNLSRQVETKFQNYLDIIGEKVRNLLAKNSNLQVQTEQLTSDLEKCKQERNQEMKNYERMVHEAHQNQDKSQKPPIMPRPPGLENQWDLSSRILKPPGTKSTIPSGSVQTRVR